MASPERKPGLPKVTEDDIVAAFTDDAFITDTLNRWIELFKRDPTLATEIRSRAYMEAMLAHRNKESSDQLSDRLRNMGVHIVEIFEHAARRERAEEVRRTTALLFSDGGGDVSQPL